MNDTKKHEYEAILMKGDVLHCEAEFLTVISDIEGEAFPLAKKMFKLRRITRFLICLAIAVSIGEVYRAAGQWDINLMLENVPIHAIAYLAVAVILFLFNLLYVSQTFKKAEHDINTTVSMRIEMNLMDDAAKARVLNHLKAIHRYSPEIESVINKGVYKEPVILSEPIKVEVVELDAETIAKTKEMKETCYMDLLSQFTSDPDHAESTAILTGMSLISLVALIEGDYPVFFGFFLFVNLYLFLCVVAFTRRFELIKKVRSPETSAREAMNIANKLQGQYKDAPYSFLKVGIHLSACFFWYVGFDMGFNEVSSDSIVIQGLYLFLLTLMGLSILVMMYLSVRSADAYKRSQASKQK